MCSVRRSHQALRLFNTRPFSGIPSGSTTSKADTRSVVTSQELIADGVDVADLAAGTEGDTLERGRENCFGHPGILRRKRAETVTKNRPCGSLPPVSIGRARFASLRTPTGRFGARSARSPDGAQKGNQT